MVFDLTPTMAPVFWTMAVLLVVAAAAILAAALHRSAPKSRLGSATDGENGGPVARRSGPSAAAVRAQRTLLRCRRRTSAVRFRAASRGQRGGTHDFADRA